MRKDCRKHGVLTEENIVKERNKNNASGYQYRCRFCRREKEQRYKEKHRKELCEKNKIYKMNNREVVNSWARKDRQLNPEKYRQYEKNKIIKYGIDTIRKKDVLWTHQISEEEYDALVNKHNNRCAICSSEETRLGRDKKTVTPLCIDHCHDCRVKRKKNIRGLLCHACNTAIGKFGDNIGLLKSAIHYLEKHHCKG